MLGRFTRPVAIALWLVLALGWSSAAVAAPRAEVLWDSWGVPHIYAQTDEDLFYALGWATMRNHADVVLRLYGQARGRAAEYWGEAYAESDAQVRTLKVADRAQAALDAQAPAFRAKLEAYVAGVNAYAAAHPGRIADEVKVVLPVAATDLLAHQQRSGVLPFAFAALKYDAEQWKGVGSNAWAIGPSHSASGDAMLVINPHIPWGEAVFGGLFRVFEVDLKSPSLDFYGSVQVGGPVVSGGFNDRLGYTHTVNTLDDVDVYELTLKDGGYLFDGQVRAFDETQDIVKVKLKDGTVEKRPITVRWSAHGPVVAEKPGKALAVRLASLDLPFQYEQFWQMSAATSLDQFKAAVRRLEIPKSNLVYADAAGNIFYLAGGRIPARKSGDYAFWAGIVPGDTSDTLWTDTLPFEALPQALNPPPGWLENANEPPWYITNPAIDHTAFPAWMSPLRMGLRPQRSRRMMTQKEKLSFEDVLAAKLSTRSEAADRLVDDLVAAAKDTAPDAAAILAGWDRAMDAESKGAVLFMAWLGKFKSPYDTNPDLFANIWTPDDPMGTPNGLADPAKAAALLKEAAAETAAKYGSAGVAFGEVHRLRWTGGVDLPANGASGSYGVFRVTDYLPDADGKKRAFQGDSVVGVVEFADPVRARFLVSYGNASQPGSPHDGDQLELFSKKELHPVWRTRAEIEAHLEEREVLP